MNTVSLIIRLNPNGEVTLAGPLQDPVLCYGMLELGKDAIREHTRQGHQRIIAPPPPGFAPGPPPPPIDPAPALFGPGE